MTIPGILAFIAPWAVLLAAVTFVGVEHDLDVAAFDMSEPR